MILITGASGKTGQAVARALVRRGHDVHAFVHRPEQCDAALAAGAKTASFGDLREAAALTRACEDVEAVYHICPNVSPAEVDIGRNIIAAARRAGLRRFVLHSVLHPQIEAMPHHWDKLRVEEMLLSTELDVTILQPVAYMQNLLAGWPSIASGVYRCPYPAATRISLVDLRDVAEAAALVLTTPEHSGATYQLVGTPPLSQAEVADVLARGLGHPIRVEAYGVEAWEAQAAASGMGAYQLETLATMLRYYAANGFVGSPNVLGWLLGRPPGSLLSFVARVAHAYVGVTGKQV